MNTLGATSPGLKLPVENPGPRALDPEAAEATSGVFGAVLGALKGSAPADRASPVDPERPVDPDRPSGRSEETSPGAAPRQDETVDPLALLAALVQAVPGVTAPTAPQVSLETLMARTMPNPAAAAPGAADPPVASATAPEARIRVTVLSRETHFAPVLPHAPTGPISEVPSRQITQTPLSPGTAEGSPTDPAPRSTGPLQILSVAPADASLRATTASGLAEAASARRRPAPSGRSGPVGEPAPVSADPGIVAVPAVSDGTEDVPAPGTLPRPEEPRPVSPGVPSAKPNTKPNDRPAGSAGPRSDTERASASAFPTRPGEAVGGAQPSVAQTVAAGLAADGPSFEAASAPSRSDVERPDASSRRDPASVPATGENSPFGSVDRGSAGLPPAFRAGEAVRPLDPRSPLKPPPAATPDAVATDPAPSPDALRAAPASAPAGPRPGEAIPPEPDTGSRGRLGRADIPPLARPGSHAGPVHPGATAIPTAEEAGPGAPLATVASEATVPGVSLPGTPMQGTATSPVQQVAEAILGQVPRGMGGVAAESSRSDGPLRLLTLQLHPADLGTVIVRMRLRDGQLEMSLHAGSEETARLLREGGEVLGDLLRQGGYQTERVTVQGGAAPAPSPAEGQAFRPQADAGASPDQRAQDQPGRRQPDGSAAAPSDTHERSHDSLSSGPDRSGVYL